jgi:hypothetical protein
MRGLRVLGTVAILVVLACGGCTSRGDTGAGSQHASAAGSVRPKPAPTDADLGSVLERYYQYVEGGHWRFAHEMLSPRLRARVSENDLMDRYDAFASSPQVTVRQTSGTALVVWLDGDARADPSRSLHVEEHVTMAWDGEQWTIDSLAPRSLTNDTP